MTAQTQKHLDLSTRKKGLEESTSKVPSERPFAENRCTNYNLTNWERAVPDMHKKTNEYVSNGALKEDFQKGLTSMD